MVALRNHISKSQRW